MNLHSGFAASPYDLSAYQAGFVRDWQISLWEDGGMNKTKVTKWLRDDAYFAEPITGNQKTKVNASHYFFSAWLNLQNAEWWYNQFSDVHHIEIAGDFQVDIYFNTLSYWNVYRADSFILPIDVWMQPPLAYSATETFVEGTNLTSPGVVDLDGLPIWINSVKVDNVSLGLFSEYNIVGHDMGAFVTGELGIFVDLPDGAVVAVDYWSPGDSSGYTPGGLSWETIFEGAGMYYATAFVPGEGGYLNLKRNPFYWMQTPLFGEVDFAYNWESGAKPRNGSFRIDIFDVIMAADAYGSQGFSTPDPRWVSGAALAPDGGVIDIFDIVTIISNYGLEWGHP